MTAHMKTAQNKELPTIALSLIVKDDNEAEVLERCLKSAQSFFDGLYITGTNKPDKKIKEITKKYKGHYSYFKWVHDFSAARNYNLSQIPESYDFFFWLDADDVLNVQNPNIIKELAVQAKIQNWSALFFPYWYQVDLDEQGNVTEIVIEHLRERLIRHDGTYKWVGPLHETLIEQRKDNIIKVDFKDPVVIHLSSPERMDKNLNRNIKILEETLNKQDGKDPRTKIYLAKAYFDRGKFKIEKERKADFDMARLLFHEYLYGKGEPGSDDYRVPSGWDEERSSAWSYLGEMARLEGQLNNALIFSLNAIQESPVFPNYYLDMSMSYVLRKDWKKAEHWLKLFTSVPIPRTTLIINRRDLKSRALEIDIQIALAQNQIDRAVKSSEELMKVLPHIEAIKKRHQEIIMSEESNKAAQSIFYLGKYLDKTGEKEKIIPLLSSAPKSLEQEKFLAEMKQRFLPAKVWGNNEIAIFCGPGFEEWSPNSLNRDGLGGSEEAVIRLSRELTNLGYKVTVYASPGREAGTYGEVEYKQFYELNPRDTFNIMIYWRAVGFVDYNLQAKQSYLWLHDVPNNPDFTMERVNKLNKIFVLSKYHKSLLMFNDNNNFIEPSEDKVMVTGNGITPEDFDDSVEIKRNPHRMIWTSSYDRGLIYLLKMWPDVIKAIPDAILDICYGWNLFDKARAGNPGMMMWKNKVNKMMEQPGITHRGRVGQDKVVELTRKAGLLVYPSDFQEIFFITGAKSQAYGAIPIVTNFAAMKETVQYGNKIDVDIKTEEGQKIFSKELIKALKDVEWQEEIRPTMMKWAQEEFPWLKVAKQWKKLFDEDSKKAMISLI